MLRAPRGILPAVVTPFREDERIDYRAWQNVIESLLADGATELFVLGGQGEFFSLNREEREVAARFAVQTANGRVPVWVNVGAITTQEAIALAQRAEDDGVECLAVITPFYLHPSADELVDHYVEVCRSVRASVLAYNVPRCTGVDLTPAVAARIAMQCENFVGVKDSSGVLDSIPQYTAAGLAVLVGSDHQVLDGLKRGASGAAVACANIVPRLFFDLCHAWESGDQETAARLQALVEPLRRALSLATFPAAVKAAMRLAGIDGGVCRRPAAPVTIEVRQRLHEALLPIRAEGYLPALAAVA